MALLCLLPRNLQHKILLLSFQFSDVQEKKGGGGMGTKPNTKLHFKALLASTMPMAAAGDGT